MLKHLLFIPLIVLVIVSVTQTQAGLYNNEENEADTSNVFLPMIQGSSEEVTFEAVPNQFVITWKQGADDVVGLTDASIQGAQVIETIDAINASVIEIPDSGDNEVQSADAVIASLENDPRVEAVDPNHIYTIDYTPNDPALDQQWAWGPTEAFAAWDVTRGDANVTIAIIDTGIQINHPDLDAKIVPGYDFVSDDNNADDGNGHGTHVAGSAAAETNNNAGGAGFCPECRLMPVRVLGNGGSGSLTDVAAGVVFAADNGANVINMSLGGGGATALRNAIDYAWSQGAFVTCAAGNNGSGRVYYPAGYDNCVAVAATTSGDQRASFSNYGTWVEVAAPGASIYSAYTGSRYGNLSGTSMAAPHVAGLAGLLASQGLTNDQIRERLCSTADDINGTGSLWSCGRINANSAVSGNGGPAPTTIPPDPTTTPPDPTTTPPQPTATQPPDSSNEAERVFELVNQERTSRGLAPLTMSDKLTEAAQVHSDDMAENNRLSHTGSDGSTVGDRVSRTDYVWQTVGENIAWNYTTPESVMEGWMNSSGHRANILRENYTEIGVALATNSRGEPYWTQVFARPSGNNPNPTPPGATATPEPTTPPGPTATPEPTTPPDPGAPSSIVNGGFENGVAPWTMSSNAIRSVERAASGSHSIQLGGEDNSTDAVTQRVQVPENGKLRFKWYPESRDMGDRLRVEVQAVDTNRRGYSSTNNSNSRWHDRELNLSSFAGTTVDITFKAETNDGTPSTFYVDDVTLTSN
ncbi:MAG: S8 family serine peptidase [Chloroflexota bacterium]